MLWFTYLKSVVKLIPYNKCFKHLAVHLCISTNTCCKATTILVHETVNLHLHGSYMAKTHRKILFGFSLFKVHFQGELMWNCWVEQLYFVKEKFSKAGRLEVIGIYESWQGVSNNPARVVGLGY